MDGKLFSVVFTQLFLFSLFKIPTPIVAIYGVSTKWQEISMCPYNSRWKDRALEFCYIAGQGSVTTISKYHCVEKQTGGLVETCSDPIKIEKGYYPKFSSLHNPPKLYQVECPKGFYQPTAGLSYEVFECKRKSECIESIGQMSSWCPDGGTTEDQQCRCDFQRGYISNHYAFANPQNKSCFAPRFENSACSMFKCKEGKELDRAYRCVLKCPTNWHRPPQELECIQNQSFSSPSYEKSSSQVPGRNSPTPTTQSTTEASTTPSKAPPTMKPTKNEDNFNVTVVAIICTSIVVFFVILILIFLLFRYKQKPVKDETNNVVLQHINIERAEYVVNNEATDVKIERADNVVNIETVENLAVGDDATIEQKS